MNKVWIKIALPLLALGLGVVGMAAIKATAKDKEEKVEIDSRPTVKVEVLRTEDYQVVINSFGEVKPLEKTQLAALVAGEVTGWHEDFVPGGVVKRGTLLFSIDKQQYEAALLQAEANLSQANAQLIEERARAEVAKREARSMPAAKVTDLYLRKPQVLSAEATVKSAEAQLKIAKRNLSYTDVMAPYDALVVSRNLGKGQYVHQGNEVGVLYNIETAEITLPIAGFDALFLPADLQGSEALISSRGAITLTRTGTIERDLGIVDQDTRMSQVVARINDPYSLNTDAPAFKFGTYVEVSLKGSTLQDIFRLPQELVTNRKVWVVNKDNELESRTVKVLREEAAFFLVENGLNAGERVVMTLPEYPQDGMKVKIAGEQPKQTKTSDEESGLVAQTNE
ncbi:efflux RND transporter periplasmic adaptor subunit [Bowmanella pacifica]|uniref:Membrane protein n=1 Tax=Bowmanella pacifica TaxID=502051 RepID=A0A917YUU4_9ALTE|nr:efflux RND transporter periplasmic adaptor subunit [Bowmanella pacifica]GGO65060.1 membrane protein [Bowmanella pacifica]